MTVPIGVSSAPGPGSRCRLVDPSQKAALEKPSCIITTFTLSIAVMDPSAFRRADLTAFSKKMCRAPGKNWMFGS
jgi:hypothetical protein